MESNHHNACRCNDCVGRRNSRRRHFVEQRPRGGNPQASSATLYEVPGDHPVTYEDDIHQSGAERPRDRVAVRTDPDGSGRVANPQRDDAGTNAEECPEETTSQSLNVGAARRQQEDARPEIGAEASGEVGEGPSTEAPDRSHDVRRDDATGPPGSVPRHAERNIDQPPEDVDWDPAPQREEIDFQQEGTVRLDSEVLTQGGESAPPREHGDIHTSAEYTGSEAAALTPDRARRRQNRRRFVLPLILALLLVTGIIGAGVLAAILLAPSQETSTAETVEPTRDLDATIAAALAMAIAAQNPAQTNPTNDGEEAAPATVQPRSESVPQIPPSPTVLSGYVNWEQTPEISVTGKLVFKARIDEGAHFVAAGDHCGFANVSLTDNANVSYGSVIPRSMSIPCGAGPGDWVSNQYYYAGNLLTVTVQLSSEIAAHPGLMLCLWTGSGTDAGNRLLDCVPVRPP